MAIKRHTSRVVVWLEFNLVTMGNKDIDTIAKAIETTKKFKTNAKLSRTFIY
jgi:hypothetical protein